MRPLVSTPSAPSVSTVEVDAESAGQRLDNFLLKQLKGVPRSHVYRLIRSGQVRVNRGRARASYRVEAGDRIRIPPVRRTGGARPADHGIGFDWLEQRIVYEDERILVLDKPAGMAVHGGSGIDVGCIEALRSLRPQLKGMDLVHRLDRGTSGCLLVAKRRSALRSLHALWREGDVEKRYLAMLKGSLKQARSPVSVPLARERRGGEMHVKVSTDGKPSHSEFRVVSAYGRQATLAEVTISTGRTHQIRVHAAHLGHPVAGDPRYGDEAFNALMRQLGLKRMFLHAHALAFEWPGTHESVMVSAPLPDDLRAVVDRLVAAQ